MTSPAMRHISSHLCSSSSPALPPHQHFSESSSSHWRWLIQLCKRCYICSFAVQDLSSYLWLKTSSPPQLGI
ncbi:hypothetical protein Bca4012_036482 [Brassica carinata]